MRIPRLTDYFGIHKCQAELDFAIPRFDEDIPLYVDPFLLWRSPSMQDQAIHTAITNSFNHLYYLEKKGKSIEAQKLLIEISECEEIGLGVSVSRKGHRIGEDTAKKILSLFESIPIYSSSGFTHFETIQLYVDGISKDRVSDFACSFMKSFLIDYTMEQCEQLKIPLEQFPLTLVYDYKTNTSKYDDKVYLPRNPITQKPVIFVPKRWLRYVPWINLDEYYKDYCPKDKITDEADTINKVTLLKFNRENYGIVEDYVAAKCRQASDCKNDPFFSQLPVTSAKRKFQELLKLPSGKAEGADSKYEDNISELFASLLYPYLDFAESQSRTDSGAHIRDLLFYNNRTIDFLDEIFIDFSARQIVFEIKNVHAIERDHINQLNRYLTPEIGQFGVLVTRNPLSKAMFRNTIDLWSGQRKCILVLNDEDVKLMVEVYESKQRLPYEILKMKYVEFRRSCPS